MKTAYSLLRIALLALVLTAATTWTALAGSGGQLSSGDRSAAPAVAALDREAQLAREDEAMLSSPDVRRGFPRLNKANFEIVGHHSKDFNCIAWSMGLDYWVNPVTGDAAEPFAPMDAMYAKLGFTRIDELNADLEPGLEKVALFATVNVDASIKEVTHAARQEADGAWTSKLGQLPIIKHATLEALRGPVYGTPVAIYVRPAGTKPTARQSARSTPTRGGEARTTKSVASVRPSVSPFRRASSGSLLSGGKEEVLAK